MNAQAQNALQHRNWTGLTLAELIEAGRVIPTDAATIAAYVKQANGPAADLDALRDQDEAVQQIAAASTNA